jgi:hypothetical protein
MVVLSTHGEKHALDLTVGMPLPRAFCRPLDHAVARKCAAVDESSFLATGTCA